MYRNIVFKSTLVTPEYGEIYYFWDEQQIFYIHNILYNFSNTLSDSPILLTVSKHIYISFHFQSE